MRSRFAESSALRMVLALRMIMALWMILALWMTLALGCGRPSPEIPEVKPPKDFESMDAAVKEQFLGLRDALHEAEAAGAPGPELADRLGELGIWFQVYRIPERALPLYRAAVEADPESSRWRYLAGQVAGNLGEHGQAAEAFRRVTEAMPDYSAAWIRLAESRIGLGESGESVVRPLERALELDPEGVRSLVVLADEVRRQGDPDRAVELLHRALELQDLPSIRYRLGLAYRDRGDLETAKLYLAGADPELKPTGLRMKDPFMAEAASMDIGYMTAMRKARQASKSRHFAVALAEYRRAAEARPGQVGARLGVARSLYALDRLVQARSTVDELLREHPDEPKVHHLAGRIYEAEEPGTGEVHYLKALELDEDLVPVLIELGQLNAQADDVAAALGYFARARDAAPESGEASVGYAQALIRSGREAEAREALRRDLETVEEPGPLVVLMDRLGMKLDP